MLTDTEKSFLTYWSANREKESRLIHQLLTGLPMGLVFGLPVVLLLLSARFWFKRADMAAHSQLSVAVLIIAVMGIAVFVAVFYRRHQWDMKEQQYLELRAKEKANS